MQVRNLRWWIAGLLAAATALNYLDRQSLPVVVGEVQKTIPITDQQFANLQMLFLAAYGVMYAGGGRIIDWLGARAGYALMIAWWSAAAFLHGTVTNLAGLGAARFLLGLGEGGGFPGSAKAVSEWFPPEERSLAFGIFNTGSSVGAVVAPPLIAAIVLSLGWRWVFFLTGILGFGWAVFWLLFYDRPERHKFISSKERAFLVSARAQASQRAPVSWIGLFRIRELWGLLGAKLLSDSAWYFYIFWLPKYLGSERNLDIKQIGYYAWIPYAFAGFGSFLGGWFSSYLLRRNVTLDRSRKLALGLSAAMMPASLLIATSPLSVAMGFFSMAMFGHQAWSTIVQTLAADMFPGPVVGSVAGLMGAVGSFGAMLFSGLVGYLLAQYHSYSPVFVLTGMMHPASFVIILVVVRVIRPIAVRDEVAAAG